MVLDMNGNSTIDDIGVDIRRFIAPYKGLVKRRSRGMLFYDYLVPGGPYEEQWDWDAFFIGMALAAEIPSEAIFLRNWALNYIKNARPDGFTPGLVTPDGPDKRLNQMKPFLAQGCWHASNLLGDMLWLSGDQYQTLRTVVLYREHHGYYDAPLGLAAWTNSMESGADNNVACLDYPDGSVAAVDINCYLYMEYVAMSRIADGMGLHADVVFFAQKAAKLKDAILHYFWCESEGTFFNIDLRTKEHIRVIGYSTVHPYWIGIASQQQADRYFDMYVLNEEELRSPLGVRTLSKRHPQYNNVNMIKPHSNWQGPVWPLATYMFVHALARYGRIDEARHLAEQMLHLCIADIRASGGMHENYDAETGEPLAAPHFISWNLLLIDLLSQINGRRDPFAIAPLS